MMQAVMFKQMALITWQPDVTAPTRDAIIAEAQSAITGALLSRIAPTVAGSHEGGDIVWHLHFIDRAAWQASGTQHVLDRLEAAGEISNLDACAYETASHGISAPDLQAGIYRTLFVSVDDAAPSNWVRAFSDDLTAMPDYIPEILNWAMNPVLTSRGKMAWSHVWEQEFSDISALLGAYMTNAYHWGYVDRWFDPEMPCQIVRNGALRHSASVLDTSVIELYRTNLAASERIDQR
jgi:hypothetical protein